MSRGPFRGLVRAYRGAPLALAVLVALLTVVCTAWPRVLSGIDDRQLDHEVSATSVLRRDVSASATGWPRQVPGEPGDMGLPGDVGAHYGEIGRLLAEFHDSLAEPARSALGEARFVIQTMAYQLTLPADSPLARASVALKVDPYLEEYVDLATGRWPVPPEETSEEFVLSPEQAEELSEAEIRELYEEWELSRERDGQIIEIVLSEQVAQSLSWPLDQERAIAPNDAVMLRLTGTFVPHDIDDDHWAHNPASAEIEVVEDLDAGPLAQAAAYTSATWRGQLPPAMSAITNSQPRADFWFPVDVSEVSGGRLDELRAQFAGLASNSLTVGYENPDFAETDPAFAAPITLSFATELSDVFERLAAQQRIAATVLAVVAIGPAAVAAGILLLGARLIMTRRQAALALMSARGASGVQIRRAAFWEGVAFGMPAVVLGAAMAVGLVRGPVGAREVVLPLAVLVVYLGALMISASPGSMRASRRDLGRVAGKVRVAVEAVVVIVTVAAVAALTQRGVDLTDSRLDVLVIAVPLLITVSLCLVVLRLYPVPLRMLTHRLKRRRGLVGFLGSARAHRDPVGGPVPTAALVVGVSVAVFSTVLLSVVSTGVRTAAWSEVGADLRLSGPEFTADVVNELRDIDGVREVATLASGSAMATRLGGDGTRAQLVVVDGAELYSVQSSAPQIDALPPGLGETSGDGRLPVLVSADLGITPADAADDDALQFPDGAVDVTIVGTTAEVIGARTNTSFVVVDRQQLEQARETPVRTRVALLALEPGADPDAVAERVADAVPVAVVENPLGAQQSFLASPLASGLAAALAAVVVVSAGAVAVAVVLALLIAAPQRRSVIQVLRTLGLGRRQTYGLIAWEMAPQVVVAFLAGGALGLVLPRLVMSSVDLRVLTGGETSPAYAVDPWLLGGVVAGLIAVVVCSVWGAAVVAGRRVTSATARMGQEE